MEPTSASPNHPMICNDSFLLTHTKTSAACGEWEGMKIWLHWLITHSLSNTDATLSITKSTSPGPHLLSFHCPGPAPSPAPVTVLRPVVLTGHSSSADRRPRSWEKTHPTRERKQEKGRLLYEARQRKSHDFPLSFLTFLPKAAPGSGNSTMAQGPRGNIANAEGAEQRDGGIGVFMTMFPLMFPSLSTEKKSLLQLHIAHKCLSRWLQTRSSLIKLSNLLSWPSWGEFVFFFFYLGEP